jgi:hypothetical protein
MAQARYATIAEMHNLYHDETSRIVTLDNEPPPLLPSKYVVLADGHVDVFEPIAELFGLDFLREMSSIFLRCPVVFRIHPGAQKDFKCQVSITRARDDTVKLFGETNKESDVVRITSHANMAGSLPRHTFEEIESYPLDPESIRWFNAKQNFVGNEVCVELYGLRLPRMDICALPGPRVEWAGGLSINKIIKPYLSVQNKITIIVHLAHVPFATSRTLGLAEELDLRDSAGLIVSRGKRDDTEVKATLSSGTMTLGWYQQSSLDQLHSLIIHHNIETTSSRYVFFRSSVMWG